MRLLVTIILMASFTMAHASTSINATLKENGYWGLEASASSSDKKDFPQASYEIKGMGTSLFTSADAEDMKKYNHVSMNAVLEFISYDKSTDLYDIKITFNKGISLDYYGESKELPSKELKDTEVLFADSKLPYIELHGKLNKSEIKTNDFGAPMVIDKSTDNPFSLMLTPKSNTLIITINKQIPVTIKLNS